MKKTTFSCLVLAFALALVLGPGASPAWAVKQFMDQFQAKYLKLDSTDSTEQAFAAAVLKAKCNVCHEGTNRKNRNVYGQALDPLLDKTADKDNAEKITKALDEAAKKKADAKNDKSPTFGEILAQHKLPGGEPKPASTATTAR